MSYFFYIRLSINKLNFVLLFVSLIQQVWISANMFIFCIGSIKTTIFISEFYVIIAILAIDIIYYSEYKILLRNNANFMQVRRFLHVFHGKIDYDINCRWFTKELALIMCARIYS